MPFAFTVFQGRAGDHNDLAIPGARAIGAELARRSGIQPVTIGAPKPCLNVGWREELDAAMPSLRQVQERLSQVFEGGRVSVAATSRCAVSLATLPQVAKYHPSACIVWFDAHGDLNTPDATTTGYLGGLALAGPAGLWDSGLGAGVSLDRIILVGQRDLDPFELDLIERHEIPHIKTTDVGAGLRDAIGGRPVYVHLDCDVLDPGIVPTDYAHEGGLSLMELKACCRVIAENAVVGLEIAEFQNSWTAGSEPVSPAPLLDALSPILGKID